MLGLREFWGWAGKPGLSTWSGKVPWSRLYEPALSGLHSKWGLNPTSSCTASIARVYSRMAQK